MNETRIMLALMLGCFWSSAYSEQHRAKAHTCRALCTAVQGYTQTETPIKPIVARPPCT